MSEAHPIRSYDDLQAVLRAVADQRQISREAIDELAGLPRGYASKVLAAVPMRRLGPDTLGPMLGALGVMLVLMPDEDARARFTERVEKRTEFRAKNAAKHAGTVLFRISRRKLRQNQRKGGKLSRAYMTKAQARKLARKAGKASAAKRWGHAAAHGLDTSAATVPPCQAPASPRPCAGTAAVIGQALTP